MMRWSLGSLALSSLLIVGCGGAPQSWPAAGDKGNEELAPVDGKADGFADATDNGMMVFDDAAIGEITSSEPFQAFEFATQFKTTVSILTDATTSGPNDLDTVIYLYRQGEDGSWGKYIGRNDDSRDAPWSAIESVEIEPGMYRVIVKGHKKSDVGKFELWVNCEGDRCENSLPQQTAMQAEAISIPSDYAKVADFASYMQLTYVPERASEKLSRTSLEEAFYHAHTLFGGNCDGLGEAKDEPFTPSTTAELFDFLRVKPDSNSEVWPSAVDVDALQALMDSEGMRSFEVFGGEYGGNCYGGDFAGEYRIVWNRKTNRVLFMQLVTYAE